MENFAFPYLKTLNKFNFHSHLQHHGLSLSREQLTTLQVNLGKLCNQACHHCHVNAGPNRTEQMTRQTADRVLTILENSLSITTLDITGGAPELNPHFRYLTEEAHRLQRHIMDRCNLTVILENGQETLADFLAAHHVEIVASLPCYLSENVDKQRGDGVFDKSIRALQKLNDGGYGKPGSGRVLNLVYNPTGNALPPPQPSLEAEYKKQLKTLFDIEFNNLFTITNMPISRFAQQLKRNGQLDSYITLLIQAFNPSTIENVMCRNLVSVDWQGNLFDCDFNQMLEVPVPGEQRTLWDIDSIDDYQEHRIATGTHCFGCVAGSGSSCGGALV
ncbi:MAG: arsenosugar biosynthesis radical SAM protein ArsS [SAR324 cluster bacterium]|nr:arsenosugar biosynthesis radical SAM protein ArsS [SAR324 cluster bacterium]